MIMGVLVIGETEKAAIDLAIVTARARPVPWGRAKAAAIDDRDNPTATLKLSERPHPDLIAQIRKDYPPQMVQLGTYMVALTFEEQPAGLFRHLSISARDPSQVPNPHAIKMVLDAFGFTTSAEAFAWDSQPTRPCRAWIEEYAPGCAAINFMELVDSV
jgi:hypothetical protein